MVIGIDLGTTFSCVGVIDNEEVKIVTNESGHRITASCVTYNIEKDTGLEAILVGDEAKANAAANPENTIFCAKRLIGRAWDDPVVQMEVDLLSSRVVEDDGRPKFMVWEDDGVARTYFPEEVSAQILMKMKFMAEDFLGEDVTEAVIAVPAYFNENQKRATRDAARIAGLTVLDLLTEPNAAAIAYGVDMQEDAERTVLVFDFGGGTFDVSILSIKNSNFEVLAIGGDAHLGGEDIDNVLACYFDDLFHLKNGIRIREENNKAASRAWRRLKARCEKLKIELSNTMIANIKIDSLYEDKDLTASLTRAKFETLNDELFQRTIYEVNNVFRTSKIEKKKIHDVILVGGSTRIPKVKKLLSAYLERSTHLEAKVNVDEAVAMGATIWAAAKSNTRLDRVPLVKLWDALPQSLGIGTTKGIMYTFITRNTRVPVSETLTFSTDKDNQTVLRFKVYEGEHTDVKKNYSLGEFRIAGIPPAPRGVPLIEVTFTVNEDCLLEVTAEELTTKRQKSIRIHHDTKRLTEEELRELIRRAEGFAEHNREVKARIMALDDLEKYARDIRTSCLRDPIKSRVPEEVVEEINDIYEWIDDWHSKKQYPKVEKSRKRKKNLEDLWNPLITELYSGSIRHEPPSILQDSLRKY